MNEYINIVEMLLWSLLIVITVAYYIYLITDFPYVETKKQYLKYLLIPFYMWYTDFLEEWRNLK